MRASLYEFGYDGADQLLGALDRTTGSSPTVLKRFAYSYDKAGNRITEQIDDNVTSANYDTLNRLTSRSGGGVLAFKGTVNEPATLTIQGKSVNVDSTNQFSGVAVVSSGTTSVVVAATDASGNVATATYEVDQTNTSTLFTYDANGNLISDGVRLFEWDARNQLTAVTSGTHRSEFSYDGLQRRVRIVEKEDGATQSDVKVVWCDKQICEERSGDGVSVLRRVFPQGEQVLGTPRFFTQDHLGSIDEVTDSSAALLARYSYDPWGRRTTTSGSNVSTAGYTGHFAHTASNLELTLYRAYDPDAGRWISEDPLSIEQRPDGESNAFGYSANRPIVRRDPLGLCTCADECPSGNWDVRVTSIGGGAIVGVDAGEGYITCRDRAVSRRAKVGCVYLGLFLMGHLGISASTGIGQPTISGVCNRSQLGVTRTQGFVSMLGPISIGISGGSVGTVTASFPPTNAGFAFADCMITPR